MAYKFKSRAAADLLMLGPQGDQLLVLLGRQPALQGIIEPAAMPAAIQALQAAIDADLPTSADADTDDESGQAPVPLRQRLWPMMEMLRQCSAAQQPIVWGV